MIRKFNPLLLLCLIVSLVGTLYLSGAFEFEGIDPDVEETVLAEESGASEEIASEHIHEIASSGKTNLKDATCTEEGGYDLIKYCACGQVMSKEHKTIEKKGHCMKTTVKNPTNVRKGIITYQCEDCYYSYTKEFGDLTD